MPFSNDALLCISFFISSSFALFLRQVMHHEAPAAISLAEKLIYFTVNTISPSPNLNTKSCKKIDNKFISLAISTDSHGCHSIEQHLRKLFCRP